MIHTQDADFTLICADVLDGLRSLEDESVHMVCTSPPYWGLRDYGTGLWAGGDEECDHKRGGVPTWGPGSTGSSTLESRSNNDSHEREGWKGGICGKCGATRQDQQLGLEATPDLYVARIVEVFREVRRVLRADGTCWVNLGDSYNADHKQRERPNMGLNTGKARTHEARLAPGLKPKDLVGIPWRVAFALQQPYYTGTIKDERDRIWLAAMIDAEGCIYVHRRKAGASNGQGYERKNDSYGSGMEISNTSRELVERVLSITGRGSISTAEKGTDGRRRQTLYRWNLRTNECRDVLREVYPHLVAKRQQARIAIGCPSSGERATAAHEALKLLHAGSSTDVDFSAPESLFEPGWYLRSDVIWSKPNPMPESVTDRPTKAHEYVFLLSKEARYFFDQEAVREPHRRDWAGDAGLIGDGGSRWAEQAGRNDYNGRTAPPQMNPAGRNVRSVWDIATQPYPEAHFATYPEELVRRCVLAGTSERGCCPVCGKPWERRIVATSPDGRKAEMVNGKAYDENGEPLMGDNMFDHGVRGSWNSGGEVLHRETLGWRPVCNCVGELIQGGETRKALLPIPCTVLDPFLGSGTTAYVARKHGRRSVGIELNPAYADLAARRMQQQSLLV